MSRLTPFYVAVVDDDESLRRSFGRLLRAAEFRPVVYASAEAFLADTRQPQFDCIVLDIELSGMSGIELKRRLTAAGTTTPVIFMTAHDNGQARADTEAAGCAAYFRKIDPGTAVLATIRRLAA